MTLFSALRADGREEGLPEGVHRRSSSGACAATHRRARHRSRHRIRCSTSTTASSTSSSGSASTSARKSCEWVKANVHPLDIVFRLAEDHGIVLLNGGGFDAPDWSVRVSFANLDDDVYERHRPGGPRGGPRLRAGLSGLAGAKEPWRRRVGSARPRKRKGRPKPRRNDFAVASRVQAQFGRGATPPRRS